MLAIIGSLIAYANIDAALRDQPQRPALLLLAGLGVALALAQLAPRRLATITACVLPTLLAAYAYEAVLFWRADGAWQWRFTRALQHLVATVPNPAVQYSPTNFTENRAHLTLPDGRKVLPLSEVANARTLMCQEGDRPFAIYDSDSYGFNNPDSAWESPRIVLLGDSFAYGACVDPRDHFVARLRARVPGTVNLAHGGNGPLLELALLREYAAALKPRYVFWFYDENNDLYSMVEDVPADLAVELEHPILARYLKEPGFSQGLKQNQAEINAAMKRLSDFWIANRLRDDTWPSRGLRFLTAPQIRALLPKRLALIAAQAAETDPVATFRRVLAMAAAQTHAFDGRFVLVSIPALTRFCFGRDYPLHQAVRAAAEAEADVVIDLEADVTAFVREHGAPALAAMKPCRGHFSERGYDLVARRLDEFLDLEEGKIALPRDGWTRRDDGKLVYSGRR